MIEIIFAVTLLVTMILGYVAVKKEWKIVDYF
jgi:hypothetical protein